MSSHNKFLSFLGSTHTESTGSTFIVEAESKTLSIEITATDEIINLPDPSNTKYEQIQYRKRVDTPRDVIFQYNDRFKGKIYNHQQQTIIFHKFQPLDGSELTWII